MKPKPVIGIRYCGGCNPRYDRIAFTRELAARFDDCVFLPAEPQTAYDAVLAVCGCPSRCVNTADLSTHNKHLLMIGSQDTLEKAADFLQTALAQKNR